MSALPSAKQRIARVDEAQRQREEGQTPTTGEVEVDEAAKTPEAPEEPKVEISDDYLESFSDDAKKVYETLNKESKGLVGKLFEKVKSVDIVKNLADRVSVWRSEKLAIKVNQKIDGLKAASAGAEQSIKDIQNEKDNFQKSINEINRLLESTGESQQGLGSKTIDLVSEKNEQFDEMMASTETKRVNIETSMDAQLDKLAEYQGSAREARERLDSRIAEKQEANNQAVEAHTITAHELIDQFESNQEEIDTQSQLIAGLENKLTGKLPKDIKAELAKKIKAANAQIKVLESLNKRMDNEAKRINKEIDKLQRQNVKMQAKRDKIFPPAEQFTKEPDAAAEKEEKAAKKPEQTPKKGVIITDGKFTYSILGNKVKRINEDDGSYMSFTVDQLPDNIKSQLPTPPDQKEPPISVAEEVGKEIPKQETKPEAQEKSTSMNPLELAQSWNSKLTPAEKAAGMGIDTSILPANAPKFENMTQAQKFMRNEIVKAMKVRSYRDVNNNVKDKLAKYLQKIKNNF